MGRTGYRCLRFRFFFTHFPFFSFWPFLHFLGSGIEPEGGGGGGVTSA